MKLPIIVLVASIAILTAASYSASRRAHLALPPSRVRALNAPTPSAEARQFSAENVRRSEAALARIVELDGIRDISRKSTVIVGRSFALAEFETKRGMLVQVMVVRHSRGLSTDFILREPINEREIGYFKDGYLELNESQGSNATGLGQVRDIVRKAEAAGALVEWSRDSYYVTVGPDFFLLDFATKEGVCRAVGLLRKESGRGFNFRLQDSMNHRHVGTFYDGVLEMK